ncbi:MAG: YbaB/EbfC family nucleoid-associated protein, partial [Xanthomonadales bacterium]|nr:YbaB/EbfC family nucleoid-associated protein [Xanthomonadales bacterium]
MKGQIGNMMQQVQRMQQDMQRAQEELANIEVEGQAGGGAVKVTMTARMDVRRVQIDPALAGDDVEMLEDLIA